MKHPIEHLPEYALGTLEAEACGRVRQHVGVCCECAAQLQQIYEALTLLALSLGDTPPPPALWRRVLHSIAA